MEPPADPPRLHALAARGFSGDTAPYARGRPSYPAAALERILAAPGFGSTVLELGAGTGKFTRRLAAAGRRVIAVEPIPAMAARLPPPPAVVAVAALAEALPLRDGSVTAVAAAQSYHWFDAPRATAEVARVLRPGGSVALVWNHRDASEPWVAALGRILDGVAGEAPRTATWAWRAAFDGNRAFTLLELVEFSHAQTLDPSGVIDRVASVSYVAALAEARREAVLAEVQELVATHPATRGREILTLPYRTEVHLAERTRR